MEAASLGECLKKDYTKIEPIKIVVRYANGKILKGYTHDFFPNKPIFHVLPNTYEPTNEGTKIQTKDLKAVFFVQDFDGNPSYNERKYFLQDKQLHGRKIEVTFRDGEVLVGTTVGYTPHRLGFFLFPADPQSNNLRVFVISAAVRKVRYL